MDDLQPQAADTTPVPPPATGAGDTALVPAPTDDSLAAHEAAHGPTAATEEPEEGRQPDGRFKRRSQRQQADADDVPTINALTARLKAAEDAAGKDIARKEGESERVYTLRRRAEIAERLATPRPSPAPLPTPAAAAPPVRQSQPLAQSFPEYEDYLQIPGNENATFTQYNVHQAQWVYAVMRERERAQEAADKAQRDFSERASSHLQRVAAARTRYADWDAVVNAPDLPPVTFVLRDAILQSAQSEEIQYHLGKNRGTLAELVAESQDYSPSAVQAMRRYLETLVATPRTSPPVRAAAGSTRSALAPVPTAAPPPPNLVRTGPMTTAEDPPGDESSLASHERFFGPKARRA